ncbi:MAG: lamin tail domain-containing protein, partial [Candidatus Nealsonbacteria bacterium]|nr:lamin tail domain-containing protein [Candidatus Nealsonbacteria bacterium]
MNSSRKTINSVRQSLRGRRLQFEPLEPRQVLSGDSTVVFNEIMYHPADGEQLEWIELHNQMAVDMDLSGWKLSGGVDYQFGDAVVMPGGSYLVVAAEPVQLAAATGFADALGPYDGRLSNGGEQITLANNSGRIMDVVDYDDEGLWPVAADGSGASLAKIAPRSGSQAAENWTFSDQIDGTPGLPNGFITELVHAGAPLVFNEVASAAAPDFWLELANAGDVPLPLAGYVIAGSSGSEYVLPGGSLGPGDLLVVTEAQLQFDPAEADSLFLYEPGRSAVLDGVRVDAQLQGRSPDATGRWLYPDVATPTAPNSFALHDEIVINEIMYHGRATPETSASILTTQPVAIDATWSYDQSGAFPAAAWNTPGFDDSGWTSGEGILFAGPFSGTSDPTQTALATLFGTGLGATGQPVGNGQADPHYRLTASAHSTPPPPDISATVMANHPAWLANSGSSKWIGAVSSGTTNVAAGDYAYETTFDLTGFVPGTATVSMNLAADDSLTDVLINGVSTGITHSGFGSFSSTRTIDSGFIDGVNTLTFMTNNGGTGPNPGGFRAELSGTALPIPANTELNLGPTTYYFRTDFQWDGDPAATDLVLTPFVDDGAVFYLNGVEVYRHNMPGGQILHTTRAGTDVTGEATFDEPVTIPSGSLVAGVNVLAVEVHQAAGGFGDVAFGAELHAAETLIEGSPYMEDPQEWIELYNRSGATVDLAGWRLDDGIRYLFAPGTTIAPGEYLVVAKDADALRQQVAGVDVVGNYYGRLSNFGDRIVLLDNHGNPADEVHYYEGGRWPQYADGGGSSLELRDPAADNSMAEAWAASDETDKSEWQTITYRGVAAHPPGSNNPAGFHEFVLGLLDAGEILIDDISVVEDPDGTHIEFIQNGSFTTGTNTWRILGNHADHGRTQIVVDPDNPGNMVLHVVATGATEHMHNHLETTFANNQTVVNGREYEISFRARWLAGSNQVNTRLYFNRLARTSLLGVPQDNGTPGGLNSQSEPNIGPTYDDLRHGPIAPDPFEPVVVSLWAADPDGLAAVDPMTLRYSVDGGAFVDVTMSDHKAATGGRALLLGATTGRGFMGVIPGQAAGAVVQFYIEGKDGLGETSTFPAAGPDSRALYAVDDGQAGAGPHLDFRLIMTAADVAFQFDGPGTTNALSNHRRGATVVAAGNEVYYDVGVRLKGSGYSRGGERTGYNIRFHPDRLYLGVHDVIAVDRTASAYGVGASHRELVLKHIATHAGGIPGMYDDLIYFIPPKNNANVVATTAQLLLSRYDDAFLDSSYENGSDGTRFKLELIYYPTTTVVAGDPQSSKIKPNTVLATDIQNMGDDKEAYRWNFLIKNQRARDDYSRIVELGKTFSLSGSTNGGELDLQSQEVMDVDQWLRNFAFESLGGVNDTYNQGYPHNLQVFVRPEDDRVVVLPWDMDFAFHHSTSMSVFGTGSNFRKIINVPNNLHHYYGHLHDIIQTTYNTAYLADWVDHYAQFAQRNVTSTILNYINARRAYVLGQLPAQAAFAVTTNNGQPLTVDQPVVSLQGNGWINVREIRLQGSSDPIDVTWTDPDSWQLTLPIGPGENVLTLQAFDFQGSPIATDSITVTSTVGSRPLQEFLRLTELNYNPADPTDDEAAALFDDKDDFEFLELQNIGPVTIDLTGASFIDGIDYTFTAGVADAGVLITEAGTGSPDYVEIQNVAAGAVDTTGWVVAINDPVEFKINDMYTALWHLPNSIGAGDVLYRTGDPDESFWGEEFSWWTTGPGWVMIVDTAGSVVDFMVWGYTDDDVASLDVTVD